MGRFLSGVDLCKDKCIMDPKNYYSLYSNLLASLVFYCVLKLSPSSSLFLLYVEGSGKKCETLVSCSKMFRM